MGILVSIIAIWMMWDNSRSKIIRIDENRVHVIEKQWLRENINWEEPISAYRGVKFYTFGLGKSTATFIVRLIHPDDQRTVDLYEAEGAPDPLLFGTTDAEYAENESAAVAFTKAVGRTLNVPVLEDID